MEHTALSSAEHEEVIARVGWAIFILSYLTQKRTHAELPRCDADDEDEDEAFDELGHLDAETERTDMLQGPADSVRSKFLDCIAQLLSPAKGWDHVCAAALRESEDDVAIDIARNDCFGMARFDSADQQTRTLDGLEAEYLGELTKYLSCQQASSSKFELLAISYTRERVDHCVKRLREFVTTLRSPESDREREYHRLLSTDPWASFLKILYREDFAASTVREHIVQQAYACVVSPEFRQMLDLAFNSTISSKLWYGLKFVARPILDCRMLRSIASQYPQFRDAHVYPLPPRPRASISLDWQVDIFEAWAHLTSTALSNSESEVLSAFRGQFKRDIARSYDLHAEIQLFMYYEESKRLSPTYSYFGCSKKACLLCGTFLSELPDPIATRGRHGICYPAWGIPRSGSAEGISALRLLEKALVSRTKNYLDSPPQMRKNYFEEPVPQSTYVSDFSMRATQDRLRKEKELELAKEEESARIENRQILEGAAMSKDTFQTNFEPHDSCVMCHVNPASRCSRCRSTWYCSTACQKADWPSHTLLCKKFATQTPRPSSNHRRAIFFPVDRKRPRMIWLRVENKVDEGVWYQSINTDPYLGEDSPFTGTMHIEHNPVRGRNLGSGMVSFAPRKEGYEVAVIHREAFLIDGSSTNRSILESVGPTPTSWRGPVVALRATPFESYEDITLADFRHFTDNLISYGTTETRESVARPENRLSATIRGVRICCYGEEKLHGSDPFVSVDLSRAHPTRLHSYGVGRHKANVSTISELVGMPLRLWKESDIDKWIDPPGWVENMTPDSNPNAAFLMMETDPKTPGWGWVPLYWNMDLGNVVAVRRDGKDLEIGHVKMMCYFARYKLQPMFEDALGLGLVRRTKQEVLDFTTWENMMACEHEVLDED